MRLPLTAERRTLTTSRQPLDTLDQVKDAVAKTILEAGKIKSSVEMEYTVQALKKIDFPKEAKALDGRLKSGGKEEDDDADATTLADPAMYAPLLRKTLSRVADDPWNWGFLVGKKVGEHRFLLHRSKNGRTLAIAAAKALSRPAKLTFGTVIRSPDDNATLILSVQGAVLSALATRVKKMLLAMKPQPISEVLLMVGGQIVPEPVDPDDLDMGDGDEGAGDQEANPALEALHNRISALEPRIAAVMQAMPAFRDRLTASTGQLMAAMEKEDVATAGPMLGKVEEVVARLEAAGAGQEAPAAPAAIAQGDTIKLQKGRLAWDRTRESVRTNLHSIEATIIADVTKHNDDPAAADVFDLDEVRSAMPRLYRVLERYDERLTDKLDEAMSASGGDRARLSAEAAAIVGEYRALLGSDDELVRIDGSGIGSPLRPVIEKTLTVLATMF